MLGKGMKKTQKIIKTGAEKGVKIEEKPLKNTCEKKIKKKLLRPVYAGGARYPQDTHFQRPPAE